MPQAKPKVIVTRRWPAVVERELAARFDVELNDSDGPLAAAALRDALTRADALCPTVSDRIDAAALDHDDLRARVLAN